MTFELFNETFVIKSTDFFFSNSPYLINRTGLPWAIIYNISVPFEVSGNNYALHPVFELVHYWSFIFLEVCFYYLAKLLVKGVISIRHEKTPLEETN